MPEDETGEEALREAIEFAEFEARLRELLRSPERVEELIRLDALRLDFDLVLALSQALAAQGDQETAELVAMAAVAAGDRKVEAAGTLALAWLQLLKGKARKARSTLDGLAGWTDPDVLGEAAYLSGVILHERGKTGEAAEEYRRAMSLPRRRPAGMSALALGEMLAEADDLDAAVRAFTFAYECGDPYVDSEAALRLAILHDRVGDVESAIPLYREAVESESPAAAPQAAFHLGEILRGAGDVDGAREAFESAVSLADPEFSPKAAVNLGIMYMDEERVSDAYPCFELAAGSPDPAVSSLGHCYLGVLLANGRPDLAEEHLRTAVKTGDRQVKDMASQVLGMMRAR